MRYSFELDRPHGPDDVRMITRLPDLASDGTQPRASRGFGEGKHYSYVSVFDARTGTIRLTSLTCAPDPVVRQTATFPDAQNLDTRALMMAFRPLDPALGHLLFERAIPNQGRQFHRGRSTFLWEEQRDPSGWKTMMRIDPERGFLVCRYGAYFEQKMMVDIEIDYAEDARWGWVPSGWRVSQTLTDRSTRATSGARVTSYTINEPIGADAFQ